MKIKRVVLGLLLLISLTGCGGSKMNDEKVKMEEWLKEKYGKEFVVEDLGYFTESIGASKEIKGTAYAKDNEEVKFEVRKFVHGGTYSPGSVTCWENYQKYYWEFQYANQIRNIINSEYMKVDISAPYIEIYKDKEIKGKTINIDEARIMYTKSLSPFITYSIFSDPLEKNEMLKSGKERIFLQVEKLRDDKFKKIALEVVYFNSNYKRSIDKTSPFGFYTNSTYQRLKDNNNILMEIYIRDINEVNSVDDIVKYVK